MSSGYERYINKFIIIIIIIIIIIKLSTAKERYLNQFGTAVLVWCGKSVHQMSTSGAPKSNLVS